MAQDLEPRIAPDKLTFLTKLSDARHRELAKQGYFPEPVRGEYLLNQTIAGLFRYYAATDQMRRDASEDLNRPSINRRRGKIGRLPGLLRNKINEMLWNGKTMREIVAYLESEGVPDISRQNVAEWFRGYQVKKGSRNSGNRGSGYRDWLIEQDRLNQMRIDREFALEIAKQSDGSKIQEAAIHVASSQIYAVLSSIDTNQLKELVKQDPTQYAKILTSLARLSDEGLKMQKYRDSVHASAERIRTELDVAKEGGLTEETLARIERELKLL